jgi:hypothetical protein
VSGLRNGVSHYSFFNLGINPILTIRDAAITVKERFNTTVLDGFFVAVECVSGHTHHLASLSYIAQLIGQIQQADLVFNDLVISMEHEGYLLVSVDFRFCHLQSKPVTLTISS